MKLADNTELIHVLTSGGAAVVRTDTLYGLVACADNQTAVELVYTIKNRDPRKSCIILIDAPDSVYGLSKESVSHIKSHTDQPTSFLLDGNGAPQWLLRQNSELAYRIPADEDFRNLLAKTGPLIAPSANPEGMPPARSIQQAKDYFGNRVDIYVDGGVVPIDTPPSRLLRIHADGRMEQLR
ncbi:MAG: Sua5/YciO/YrdC/YwlC family protein [Candidatus Saccharimonadales bacterium]